MNVSSKTVCTNWSNPSKGAPLLMRLSRLATCSRLRYTSPRLSVVQTAAMALAEMGILDTSAFSSRLKGDVDGTDLPSAVASVWDSPPSSSQNGHKKGNNGPLSFVFASISEVSSSCCRRFSSSGLSRMPPISSAHWLCSVSWACVPFAIACCRLRRLDASCRTASGAMMSPSMSTGHLNASGGSLAKKFCRVMPSSPTR
mmetsp:Transcript_36262/g.90544  ORF Transcript_36262/g.90544 Transcript_36262/m.90544 type:complete len:200 (+) Transcript_36262:457-1056(+)